jgi:hypothetical protein
MDAWLALLMMAAAPASGPASDSADGWRLVNPKAIELFEADGKLMAWALARFDEDHDGYLSIMEADAAAREFKRIADGDRDGRVTPAEYRAARAFIVARSTSSEQAQATRR